MTSDQASDVWSCLDCSFFSEDKTAAWKHREMYSAHTLEGWCKHE